MKNYKIFQNGRSKFKVIFNKWANKEDNLNL
jgi:hypothetical protein